MCNLDLGGLNGFPSGFRFTFGDNYDLKSLIMGANTTVIPDYVCNCFGALESLTLPDGLTTIGISAFEECSNLSKVTIPDSVKSIGINAFAQTTLRNVHLPAGLQYIHASSFGSTLEYVCCDTEDCPAVKQFAENTEIEFRLCDGHAEQVLVAGDASGDGILDLKDTVLIRRYLAGGWDVELA